MEDYLYHYGLPRRSGRYPYGSGEDPFQRIKRKMSEKRTKKKIQVSRDVKEKIKKESETVKEKKKQDTNEELSTKIARIKLENEFLQQQIEYNKKVATLHPKKVSWGKKFLKDAGAYILDKAVKDVGSQAATYFLGTAVNEFTGKAIWSNKNQNQSQSQNPGNKKDKNKKDKNKKDDDD